MSEETVNDVKAEKVVRLRIKSTRGIPATTGVYLKEGTPNYQKLKPGQIQELSQKEFKALSAVVKDLIEVV